MASLRRRWAERAALCVVGAALRQLYVFVARRRRARELPAAATSLPPPPHILLVLLDDAGLGDASVLGHPLVRTPHVDAFFASAVRFTQAYAGAPNCSPSRAALLTGRAPFRTGVYDFLSKHTGSMHLSRGEQTVASLLAGGAAYDTLHLGKWHLSRAAPAGRRARGRFRGLALARPSARAPLLRAARAVGAARARRALVAARIPPDVPPSGVGPLAR